ncbi:MAG: HigA family addiction module antitoxin [bacterium]|nr:HigA family addiction module antitoxin [bacterium]
MKARKLYSDNPDYIVSPGETIRETMSHLGMSQAELAMRLGLTVQTVNRVFKGEQPITYETANRLEMVTGTPAAFWNNLEMQYRGQLTKQREHERLANDLGWLACIPYKELIKRNVIKSHADRVMQLREVLAFFGVSSVEAWCEIWENPEVAARRSACFATAPGAAATWIRLGELAAQRIETMPFNKSIFEKALQQIRKLTRETADNFVSETKRLCAESGVALVLIPEIRNAPWNGATKWLTSHKALIIVNLRGKAEDRFWFSFFHEAGHVLKSNKKQLYIADASGSPEEVAADSFAAEILIPQRYNDSILKVSCSDDVLNIADKLSISPGIVAGRYQYLTGRWGIYREMIRRLQWE